ncbi:MAG: polysaccharide deacetylase family protein [Pseudomonadota bacterium]
MTATHRTPLRSALRARAHWALPAQRPRMQWPGGARVAAWIAPNIEFYEYLPQRYPFRDQFARATHPDVMQWGFRDHGNRVALWRMADALAQYPVAVTASTNLCVFEHYPEVAQLVRDRGWEVMSHGLYNTHYLGLMSDEQERAFHRVSAQIVQEHTGQTLQGLLGPCVTNGPSTLDLMVEAGLRYHADWVHDDVPVPMKTDNGLLWTVPYHYEINDAPLLEGHFDADALVRVACDQFDRLYREADEAGEGLVYCWPLHPYLIGQAHTVAALRRVLDHICAHDGVWHAQAHDIVRQAQSCYAGDAGFQAWLREEVPA